MKYGNIIKCATDGCENTFSRTGSSHLYCDVCIKERNRRGRKEWERRQHNDDPVERRKFHRMRARKHRASTKEIVLAHYGKEGKPLCKWIGCSVCDIDMLSLDHVENDGKLDRNINSGGGHRLYMRVIKLGYPEGFQTLCFNHQFKKEILRRRKLWI
jgi:hypothetical protein